MTCLSKKLFPADITFIVDGVAFKQWKLTLRDAYSPKSIPVVGDLQGDEFRKGQITEEAIERMVKAVRTHLKTTQSKSCVVDYDRIREYLRDF